MSRPSETKASQLGRYHRCLAAIKRPAALIIGAARFCVAERIGYGNSDDFAALYEVHSRRVRGESSPKECDDFYRRLVIGQV